ncbi:DUF3095 domain-containing protein [Leptospira haakeii]|uniref:DUF3095 domain-containing protein n=1 Tax=Leptospira haakeii TaxID=2023198 RepID=A0ABX4PLS5_9LEPT|nr:DUF3095 domain-containing protein [Leptospira haakeii]PKA16730.1 hypothetical protein CH363_08170 [Leptospira haakeii]PKA20751.1 hypothetical protein CH377_07575 [Leptospira haakeii]
MNILTHSTINFYKELPEISQFSEVTDSKHYRKVPDDWIVIVTDIVKSTEAILEGRYKDVNMAGGLTLMGITNLLKDMEFPFFFGGDGVTILLPGSRLSEIRDILADTREFVRDYFKMDLRIGFVPVSDIYEAGYSLTMAKLRISKHYTQAVLGGTGVAYAEIKIKEPNSRYLTDNSYIPNIRADFSGFTCRWKDIQSPKGEMVSLIVKINSDSDSEAAKTLSGLLSMIDSLYGSEREYHPLREENLIIEHSSSVLNKEATASSKGNSILKKLYLWKIKFETYGAELAIRWNLPLKAFHYKLNKLKNYQIISSDFRKFDGTFKMVFATDTIDRKKLESSLEEAEKSGKLNFGIHISDRALMTCLLHAGTEREVHFIDGAGGGYALAATVLKKKLQAVAA